MKVGDLVKWSGWKYPMLIVGVQDNIRKPTALAGAVALEKYCRCWFGGSTGEETGDCIIDLFESDLEVISESR